VTVPHGRRRKHIEDYERDYAEDWISKEKDDEYEMR
jgi:hypothetical protein